MLETLDAEAVRRWCAAGLTALRRHEHEINQLNVYPVPDGDTGTNLVLTLAEAERALVAQPGGEGPAAGLWAMARGALLGARGNSGVIVAQMLRGFADALASAPVVGGRAFADALTTAAKVSYAAVAAPVEGTILSVATAAARAAVGTAAGAPPNPGTDPEAGSVAGPNAGLGAVVRAAADAAASALARTPEQLPVLATAGVVDAGGRGLVVLLDALVEVVAGAVPDRPVEPPARTLSLPAGACGPSGYAYEVQYLLDADAAAVTGLRATLGELGDSLAVVGTGDGTWNVHIHVDDVGAAIEAGVAAGRPYQISVTRFADHPPRDPRARGAVVVASGAGLVELFSAEGAVVVGGPPSTAEVLAAIRAARAGEVVVLPNDPDAHAVATTAAEEAMGEQIQVAVVPTRSPVQALAALAIRDRQRRFHDDVIAMAEAAGACRYAEVVWAARDALTMAGRCRAGDVLALVEGEVHLIGTDLRGVCRQLLDQLLGGGGELVTLLAGAEAPAQLIEDLTDHLGTAWPFVEVQSHQGGQPYYPLVVGVE